MTPSSLAGRVYVLAYDRDRERLRAEHLGYTVAAAALTELWLGGYLADDAHTVTVVAGRQPPDDPVLRALLQRIRDGRPRSWRHLIGDRGVERAVRAQLADRHVLRVLREKSLLRAARVYLVDRRAHTRLAQRTAAALRGPDPVERLDARDAALVALLATGHVRTAISRARLRDAAPRVALMTARGGPAIPALAGAIRSASSSAG